MTLNQDIGRLGEDLAVEYLEKDGFKIFDRNYKLERKEIDIVAFWEEPAELHMIEVKTRTKTNEIDPAQSLSPEQEKNMAEVARFYLRERQFVTVPVVFDLITVALDNPDEPQIQHLEDVFRP